MTNLLHRAGFAGLTAGLLLAGSTAAYARRTPPVTTPPSNTDEWALINLTPDMVASANGGAGVKVALMDGETDCTHVDLTGHCENNLIPGGRYRRYDSHGTHTAGIIAGKKYGVAPSAFIVNYAVFDDRSFVATGTKLRDAWYGAYAKGASISSMSFGCTQLALCFSTTEVGAMADPNLKLLFVKAAGNDGTNLLNESIAVSQQTADAAMARLILVGSVALNGTISSFSNRPGDTCFLYSGASTCTDPNLLWKNHFIVAPGENIYSTLPGNAYGYMSGTSMATPVVSGVAALLEARWPALKTQPETVAQILFTTATDLGAPGVDSVYGWGLLNAGRAFQAQGNVAMVSTTGSRTIMNGTSVGGGPVMTGIAAALGGVTVWDKFGRDYALAQSGQMRVRPTANVGGQLLGRAMLGLGGQDDWAGAMFTDHYAPRGFALFNSPALASANAYTPDRSLRMGVDMPFKGGMVQLRLTGNSDTQADFAYDPTLRAMSFFASTGLMKNSLFANTLLNLSADSRLALYGTTSRSGSLWMDPGRPLLQQLADRDRITQMALTGTRSDQRQQTVGAGYWLQPDRNTVLGFNASVMTQKGGYYDLSSNLPLFDKPTRLINIGAAASRKFGSWEATAAGEVTDLRTSASMDPLMLTPAKVASARVQVRKAGLAFGQRGSVGDSIAFGLVMPPRAIAGKLHLAYMMRTPDGLGQQAAVYNLPLSALGTEPVKFETAYRLQHGDSWSLSLTGGLNLGQSYYYRNAGEGMANFRLAF